MQIHKDQLARQQMIMRVLNFYGGKIDGIWGPSSIEAKRAWELSGTFSPAYPSNGLPLSEDQPAPRGVRYDRLTKSFTHSLLTPQVIESLGGELQANAASKPLPVAVEPEPTPAVVEPTPEPVKEEPAPKASDDSEQEQEPTPVAAESKPITYPEPVRGYGKNNRRG